MDFTLQSDIPLESLWRPPSHLPSFENCETLSIDTETKDPLLKSLGPSWIRSTGNILGVSISDGNQTVYLPMRHEGGDNLDETIVTTYLKDLFSVDREYIFANAFYDLGWLAYHGIQVNGRIRDIQVAESLLDETRIKYDLDTLAHDYLGQRKNETVLEAYAKEQAISAKNEMWKMPARFVGAYAESDAEWTYNIYQKQIPKLKEEGLWEIWELECQITPICLHMTQAGVRVDLDEAEQLNQQLKIQEQSLIEELWRVNIWSGESVGLYFEEEGISVPRTSKGNFSCDKNFLENVNHPYGKKILNARTINRLRGPFLEKNILANNVGGRIHAQFLQTARAEGGTKSGRFSSRMPNLQQVPKRSELGKRLRKLYKADIGHLWAKCDYNSQEPRLLLHYALTLGLRGAEDGARYFAEGKKLYHLIEENSEVSYADAKMVYLGLTYGMAIASLSENVNMTEEEAYANIMTPLKEKCPFMFDMAEKAEDKAQVKGFIRTILGRKSRFNWWQEANNAWSKPIKSLQKARTVYKGKMLQRAFINTALNRLIQGSAADQTKKAMVDLWAVGIKSNLQVHDELNFSACESEKQALQMKEIMENTLQLKLPSVVDLDLGDSWC